MRGYSGFREDYSCEQREASSTAPSERHCRCCTMGFHGKSYFVVAGGVGPLCVASGSRAEVVV